MKVSNNNFFPNSKAQEAGVYEEPSSSEGFAKFCQQTSLHGWVYLDSEPGALRKIVWILVLVLSAKIAALPLKHSKNHVVNFITVKL